MRRAHGRNPRYRAAGNSMVNFKFGINFEFIRDKSVDKLVKEHEYELLKLKAEREEKQNADKTN
jgi:hypothetical protein